MLLRSLHAASQGSLAYSEETAIHSRLLHALTDAPWLATVSAVYIPCLNETVLHLGAMFLDKKWSALLCEQMISGTLSSMFHLCDYTLACFFFFFFIFITIKHIVMLVVHVELVEFGVILIAQWMCTCAWLNWNSSYHKNSVGEISSGCVRAVIQE